MTLADADGSGSAMPSGHLLGSGLGSSYGGSAWRRSFWKALGRGWMTGGC